MRPRVFQFTIRSRGNSDTSTTTTKNKSEKAKIKSAELPSNRYHAKKFAPVRVLSRARMLFFYAEWQLKCTLSETRARVLAIHGRVFERKIRLPLVNFLLFFWSHKSRETRRLSTNRQNKKVASLFLTHNTLSLSLSLFALTRANWLEIESKQTQTKRVSAFIMHSKSFRVVRADTSKKLRLNALRVVRAALRAVAPELFPSSSSSSSSAAAPATAKRSFTTQELKAIATYIKIVCEQPNLNVIVGVDDFSAFVKYRKSSLTYVVCDVKPKPVRVLIYESFKLTAAEDAEIESTTKSTPERVAEAEMKLRAAEESEDATEKKKIMKSNAASKKDAAVITEGNESLPKCVEALALDTLNDKSYESTEKRATELRKRLSERFGDYWHVIHDDNPFVVACDKTTFAIIENRGDVDEKKNDKRDEEKKEIDNAVEKELYFVAQKGRAVYTAWHHNAPAKEKFFSWFWRMESSEKLKLLRYFCLFNATGLAVISRAVCGFEKGGIQNTKSLFCRAGPTFTPVLIGIFLCIAFSTSVFARIRTNGERRLAKTLSAAVAVTSPSKRK